MTGLKATEVVIPFEKASIKMILRVCQAVRHRDSVSAQRIILADAAMTQGLLRPLDCKCSQF